MSREQSTEEVVRSLHPELSDYEVQEMVQRLEMNYQCELAADLIVQAGNSIRTAQRSIEQLEKAWLRIGQVAEAIGALQERPDVLN